MFEKAMVRGLAAAALAATMLGGSAMASFIPPFGLAPGSKYQIAFVTADTTSGTSGLESYYNNFVTEEAAPLTAVLPSGTTWSAITSTYDGTSYYNAIDNAPTHPGVPIYNTAGQLVSDGTGWFNIPLPHPIDYTQLGILSYEETFTGTDGDGDADPTYALGSLPNHLCGYSGYVVDSYWLDHDVFSSGAHFQVYALSSPITVPEPTTLALLGAAVLGLAAVYLRRRGAKA